MDHDKKEFWLHFYRRVLIFPLEYVEAVARLLYMDNFSQEDPREQLMNFEGFNFDVDSQDFKERVAILEVLDKSTLEAIYYVITHNARCVEFCNKRELLNYVTISLQEFCNVLNANPEIDDAASFILLNEELRKQRSKL